MNYLGGKFRQGRRIAQLVASVMSGTKAYIEPFCGAMGSSSRVCEMLAGSTDAAKPEQVWLSDQHPALITTWQYLLRGWLPPDVVTEEMYLQCNRNRDDQDPLTAYVGFGMGFGGKYFGGFARSERGAPSSDNERRSIVLREAVLRKAAALRSVGADVAAHGYLAYDGQVETTMYLDPPYAGRTKQSKFTFDHDQFWDFARRMSRSNIVLVSEFTFPDDFVSVLNFGDTVVRHHSSTTKGDGTQEHMVMHNSLVDLMRSTDA